VPVSVTGVLYAKHPLYSSDAALTTLAINSCAARRKGIFFIVRYLLAKHLLLAGIQLFYPLFARFHAAFAAGGEQFERPAVDSPQLPFGPRFAAITKGRSQASHPVRVTKSGSGNRITRRMYSAAKGRLMRSS